MLTHLYQVSGAIFLFFREVLLDSAYERRTLQHNFELSDAMSLQEIKNQISKDFLPPL